MNRTSAHEPRQAFASAASFPRPGGNVTGFVWPLAARAQQPAKPVIGFLNFTSPDAFTERLRGFRQGLKDFGYVEGENVAIEYRCPGGLNPGRMFWLWWKTLSGSYVVFTSTSRS
jgi:hypothetical protein